MTAGGWSFIIYRQWVLVSHKGQFSIMQLPLGVLVKRQESSEGKKRKENGRHLVLRSFSWLLWCTSHK